METVIDDSFGVSFDLIVEPAPKTCDFFTLKELKELLLVSGYLMAYTVPSSVCCGCAASFRHADLSIKRHRCVDDVLRPLYSQIQIRYLAIVVVPV